MGEVEGSAGPRLLEAVVGEWGRGGEDECQRKGCLHRSRATMCCRILILVLFLSSASVFVIPRPNYFSWAHRNSKGLLWTFIMYVVGLGNTWARPWSSVHLQISITDVKLQQTRTAGKIVDGPPSCHPWEAGKSIHLLLMIITSETPDASCTIDGGSYLVYVLTGCGPGASSSHLLISMTARARAAPPRSKCVP